jgi:hypothetical protein
MTEAGSRYLGFAERLLQTGLILDPWLPGDNQPRFREAPVWLSAGELRALYDAAEGVAEVVDEACRLCAADPGLIRDFLGLTPAQQMMWAAAMPLWHGLARADVFRTEDGGIAVCELNSDTPTGEPEALVLGRLALADVDGAGGAMAPIDPVDPNWGLGARYRALLRLLLRGVPGPRTLGLVYPTEMTEDLGVVALYREWLAAESQGGEVVLGSPFNLEATEDGGVALLGQRCDLVLRHYKTDWWGERLPVWEDDEPFLDQAPLLGPLSALLEAQVAGRVAIVNPFGAVVSQNKRLLSLMWEQIARFSPRAQRIIRAHVPYTVRLETLDREALLRERAGWVLKSDYGCEGDEVIIGALCPKAEWEECVYRAAPGRFVAQRYFAARREEDGSSVNHGVFLIGGGAAGIYARVQRGATTHEALSAPVLVHS